MNQRRKALVTLGFGALAGMAAFRAGGQPRMPRIVFLSYYSRGADDPRERAFFEGMKDFGYEEGRNIIIERRSGQLSREATVRLAAEIVASAPALIVGQGFGIAAAATATRTIPIVGAYSGDMVDAGMAKSLANPGGNVTGVQLMSLDLATKRVELLKDLLPNARRIAVIADPQHPGEHRERDVSAKAAERLGMRVLYHPVRGAPEFEAALAAARSERVQAILFFPDSASSSRTVQAAEFAIKHRLPTVAGWDFYAEDGQLISYGPSLRASWRRLAYFVDRILKGASPGSLPIEFPTVLELIVNMKTARAIGVKVPQSILVRADRVIE